MIKYLHILLAIIFIWILNTVGFSQRNIPDSLVKYTPEYKFTDGIFLNFQQVKANCAIKKQNIFFDKKVDDFNYFERLLDENVIKYYDSDKKQVEVLTRSIWGYADKGMLYIRWTDEFYRVFYIGTVCHFIAYENVYRSNYNDPFMYSDPFYSSMRAPIQSKEMRQFFLDFETGQVIEYGINNFMTILMRDKDLYDEYIQLNKRKKRQMMFLYLRKFNEKHPLFLPVN
ncbi:MAG TPA: hypothetical protein DDX39_08325 [Bacteroidales bacterium]|nr:MAG: hypothetical protein A2W98_09795 [Bacteroidetes bacterium GWF2_33_38]OFY73094.1 MAG: hypothetical protein A2265_00445 [Bacteroidetes bacterium RIFOXYA12_FULL_33_9]HBF88632.1 hypothetical protein [Bacteroidales bacterium]